MPRCSIIVPAYNAASYARPAIESALTQTHTDTEVIVVNDGSTDATSAVLDTFGRRIVRIDQPNLGVAAARNRGLAVATGEYVALLDADDEWLPDRLERMLEFLHDRAEFGLVTSDAYFVSDGTVSSTSYYQELPGGFKAIDQPRWILQYNFVLGMTLIRRRLFERHGTFDESLRVCEDWDLWIRFLWGHERVGLVDVPLAYYRRRGDSLSSDMEETLRAMLTVAERALDRTEVQNAGGLGAAFYQRGWQALALEDRRRASRFFAFAARDVTLSRGTRIRAALAARLPAVAQRRKTADREALRSARDAAVEHVHA